MRFGAAASLWPRRRCWVAAAGKWAAAAMGASEKRCCCCCVSSATESETNGSRPHPGTFITYTCCCCCCCCCCGDPGASFSVVLSFGMLCRCLCSSSSSSSSSSRNSSSSSSSRNSRNSSSISLFAAASPPAARGGDASPSPCLSLFKFVQYVRFDSHDLRSTDLSRVVSSWTLLWAVLSQASPTTPPQRTMPSPSAAAASFMNSL